MKRTNFLVIFMMNLLIVACGGGGESSTSDSVVAVVAQPIAVGTVKPDPNAIYDTTAELIAAKSFLLEQEYELAVSYKSDENRSAYLSVCSEFTEGQDGIKVNYNSCLLRTSIDREYTGTLKVANDNNRLVMTIWYLDDIKNPRYAVWINDSDDEGERTFAVN